MHAHLLPSLALWDEALRSPMGIFIRTNDTPTLRSYLYTARKQSGVPELDAFTVRFAPGNPTGELWLVRNSVPDSDE